MQRNYSIPSTRAAYKYVPKDWGWERWVQNNDLYCLKEMFCATGRQCSWHFHKEKDETFFVLVGSILVLWKDSAFAEEDKESQNRKLWINKSDGACQKVLKPGDSIRIMPYTRHRFSAVEDCLFIETSTHHNDLDVFRL